MTTQKAAMSSTEAMEHDAGRNVYVEPRERALIRTADIYQTELDDGVEGYSKTLLSIVASCTNGGKPDGYNVQAMVGRSKRGEVAVRMFAVVDDAASDPVFKSVGFQVRGCAAMVACASVACSMIEGRAFSDALRITPADIERAVDGLAPARRYTALFAAECVRALVGDWMYRCGMGLEEMDEHLACDESSVTCLMCEHCSLRDSRIDLRVAAAMAAAGASEAGAGEPAATAAAGESTNTDADTASDAAAEEGNPEATARELAENNALAAAFDEVRRASAAGKLATWEDWESAGIVPAHMETVEFSQLVLGYLENWRAEHAEDIAREQQKCEEKKRAVRSASRCVGVPPTIPNRRLAQIEAEKKAADSTAGSTGGAATADVAGSISGGETDREDDVMRRGEIELHPAAACPGNTAADDDVDAVESASAAQPQDDDPFASLNVPEGYRLVELDGEIVLVKDETAAPARKTIDCSHIAVIEGLNSTYLYDTQKMTQSYAHWAHLAAEDDPVVTFAECVREDSRVYPRPYRASNLQNEPFCMSEADIEAAWKKVSSSEAYADIERTSASNGDVYFYSTRYLSEQYAASLAEYASVIRPACV